jgi:trans-aconitate 2-methyltransferase
VFSTATFHWIADHRALFAELARVLRPGGRLAAQCGGGANIAAARAVAAGVAALPAFAARFEGWEDSRYYAWPEDTEARLIAAGFTRPRAWLEAAPTVFDGPDACAEFMRSCILRPWLSRLATEADRTSFASEVVARLGRADAGYTLDYWRLNIEAERG